MSGVKATLSSQLMVFSLLIEECRRQGITDPELIDLVWVELEPQAPAITPGGLVIQMQTAIQSALFI